MKIDLPQSLSGLILAFLLVSSTTVAQTPLEEFPVTAKTLKNGMKILVQPDTSIPNGALYLFYRVGSRNERPGTTGLSHFFEHMMFNGSKHYRPGEFDKVMEANGGSNNAYTTKNVTVYQDWFPRSALPVIFDLESDRIENLAFDPKRIESERGVVASERRLRVDNSNWGILDEQLWAMAFTAHPYQWPVVGWMSDIEHWTSEDLMHHFRMGYAPNNATMVAVGDVSPEEIFALSEKTLEKIPQHDPPPAVSTIEPEQLGERRLIVRKAGQLPLLELGYHIPETSNPDTYALNLLRAILFDGESSRMYRRLVDHDQIALSVDGNLGVAFDPTLLTIEVEPKEGVHPETCERAIDEEIERVGHGEVTDQELEKAKNMRLMNFYHQLQTIDGRANTLGTYELFFGGYTKLFDAPEAYAKVTKGDIESVARKYLNVDHRTVATLLPTAEKGKP